MEPFTNTLNNLTRSQKTVKQTGAQALMHSLLAENVELIFGYPGGAIMPVYDALYDFQEVLKHVLVRHEQGATHAAEGYARATGKTGVVFATSGPGATNLVTGLADALMDSVPMVCIVGQVTSNLLGTDAFQEANVMSVCNPVTKWTYQITDAKEIPQVVHKAFYIARSGRPGPVVVEITKNAQLEMLSETLPLFDLNTSCFEEKFGNQFSTSLLQKAAKLINNSKAPLILAGNGVGIANAEGELLHFAEKTGIPVACTLHGLSCLDQNNPLYVGMLGMHGNYAPNVLTNQADLLIAIGMRFDDRVTGKLDKYAKQAKVIHIEIDPSEIDKIVPATVPLQGDAKDVLQALLPLVEDRTHTEWLKTFKRLDEQEQNTVRNTACNPEGEELTMPQVIHTLGKLTNGKAMVVADVGQHQMIAARYYPFAQQKSYFTSGGLGTMGFALPAAMGAKMGAPDREVVAVIGDGCFQMTLQELGTIKQYGIAVKALILNNNYLGMVRQWQSMFFNNRYSFVNMENTDFEAIAKAYGLRAKTISTASELTGALQEMLESEEAYILNVMVKKEDDVFPMMPTGAAVDEMLLSFPGTKKEER
ncbi:MAG: biosynthetic-type acetolactate synthase large subunit [Chitinophagales bacterium]|nr:biosynthetic-type acetolactate synthase large subunit [Chitinophagales bacterium]